MYLGLFTTYVMLRPESTHTKRVNIFLLSLLIQYINHLHFCIRISTIHLNSLKTMAKGWICVANTYDFSLSIWLLVKAKFWLHLFHDECAFIYPCASMWRDRQCALYVAVCLQHLKPSLIQSGLNTSVFVWYFREGISCIQTMFDACEVTFIWYLFFCISRR